MGSCLFLFLTQKLCLDRLIGGFGDITGFEVSFPVIKLLKFNIFALINGEVKRNYIGGFGRRLRFILRVDIGGLWDRICFYCILQLYLILIIKIRIGFCFADVIFFKIYIVGLCEVRIIWKLCHDLFCFNE